MTTPIRNVSGQDLIVPALGRQVLAGQIIDVPDGDVDSYVCQTTTWQIVNPPDVTPPSDTPTVDDVDDPSEED